MEATATTPLELSVAVGTVHDTVELLDVMSDGQPDMTGAVLSPPDAVEMVNSQVAVLPDGSANLYTTDISIPAPMKILVLG